MNKGLYILAIWLNRGKEISVGALGSAYFSPGLYVYIGSAQKALQARIRRHLSPASPVGAGGKKKRLFWHIDYLLEGAEVIGVRSLAGPKEDECRLSEKFSQSGGEVVMKGFGASDCSCPSHLYYFGAPVRASPAAGKRKFKNILDNCA